MGQNLHVSEEASATRTITKHKELAKPDNTHELNQFTSAEMQVFKELRAIEKFLNEKCGEITNPPDPPDTF